MQRCVWLAVVSLWLVSAATSLMSAASPQTAPPQTPAAAAQQETIARYCVTCHNDRLKTSGLSLEKADVAHAAATPELWENVARKLQARAMPPQGSRRPDEATYRSLETAIEQQLDAEAAARPNPGAPILHRLNRSEYANAIRDLLALDVDVTSLLPPDDAAYGFDNISDVLGVSPSLQERYLSAASKIAAIAVGDPDIMAGSDTFRIRQDLSQDQHVEGLPLGTIGGTAVRYTFPLDGDYVFQVKLYRTNLNIMRGLEYPHEVEFAIDGRRVYAVTIGGHDDLEALFDKPTDTSDAVDARLRVRVPVTPGRIRCRWRSSKIRLCRSRTACSRSCGAQLTTSTGPDVRTCRRSRLPARSTPLVPATRRAGARSSRASRRRRDAPRRSSRLSRIAPIAGP